MAKVFKMLQDCGKLAAACNCDRNVSEKNMDWVLIASPHQRFKFPLSGNWTFRKLLTKNIPEKVKF